MVVRLGVRPPEEGLAGAGYRRILQGQRLTLHTISDAAVTLRAWVRVIYDDGSGQLLTIPEAVRSASRVPEALASTDVVSQNGWIVNAEVEMLTDDIKRGQTYVRLAVEPFGAALLADYCFSEFGHVSLGTFIQAGPGGGGGHLRMLTIKADGAPADFSFTPALSNMIRLVHNIYWFYTSSGDVASRILNLRQRQGVGGIPTGFGVTGADYLWESATLTLTANQDGSVWVTSVLSGINDNGTIAVDNQASAPSPFPWWVTEDDNRYFRFFHTDEEAADFELAEGLVEDWVIPS